MICSNNSHSENECKNLEMHPANVNRRLESPTEGSHGGSNRQLSSSASFVQLNDAADEFFYFPDETVSDQRDMFPSDESTHVVVSSLFVCIKHDRTFVKQLTTVPINTQFFFTSSSSELLSLFTIC
jgi:hypothetical protein